ncbi:MAG: GNAT family N-acetyltransferase [Clostridiales bacterium]|nr:GNAT family N-acetyltransferase [Clostridiales bacterium]
MDTDFGETLSWRYLQYTREHPVTDWNTSTAILYASKDNLTDRVTVDEFARRFGCGLTIMEDGEHWFHTQEQLVVLRNWEEEQLQSNKAGGTIEITHGTAADIDSWMKLVRRMRDLFPGLETEPALSEHRKTVLEFMDASGAVCAKDGEQVVGALLFSPSENVLCYLAVDDRYQRRHIAQDMIRYMLPLTNPKKEITVTTYRENDPNGTAARAFYQHLGFEPGALTEEFGSPVQVFILKR